MMSPNTLQELEMWTRELGTPSMARLLERISICLLEGRARLLASCQLRGDGSALEEI